MFNRRLGHTLWPRAIESLKKQKTQTKNRFHAVSFVESLVFPEFQQSIDLIDKQIDLLQKRALFNVRADKNLKTQFEALLTLPGFGEVNALNVLSPPRRSRVFVASRQDFMSLVN